MQELCVLLKALLMIWPITSLMGFDGTMRRLSHRNLAASQPFGIVYRTSRGRIEVDSWLRWLIALSAVDLEFGRVFIQMILDFRIET